MRFCWRNCRVVEACGIGFELRTRTPSILFMKRSEMEKRSARLGDSPRTQKQKRNRERVSCCSSAEIFVAG